ncbi:MAG TPA: hypothetical protein VM032_03270, partial [Vicinamibacterales bacterium]|nr:hypothetical protein [Vicinamibacterales bacterium]
VKAALAPGSLRIYDKADLTRQAPFARTGPHDPGVRECVLTLEFAGRAPGHVTVVGAVPAHVGMGLGLSAALAASVPAAVEAIAAALVGHGAEVHRRACPASGVDGGDPWWRPRPPASVSA